MNTQPKLVTPLTKAELAADKMDQFFAIILPFSEEWQLKTDRSNLAEIQALGRRIKTRINDILAAHNASAIGSKPS